MHLCESGCLSAASRCTCVPRTADSRGHVLPLAMLDHAFVQARLLPDHIASGFSPDATPSWIAHTRGWTRLSSRQTCWTRSDIRWTASAVIRLNMRWDHASPLKMVYETRKPPSEQCHNLHCTAKVSTCQISRVLHVYRRLLSYLSVGVDVFALAKMNTRPVAGRPVLRGRLDSL